MIRRILILSMVITLSWVTVSCGGAPTKQTNGNQPQSQQTSSQQAENRLSDGQYPVQQATYNDDIGEYEVALLNTKPGESSIYRVNNLQMARLTNEEISAGQKSYLKVENGQPSLHLTEDFRIEYIHNVTQTQTDPQSGEQRTVVVERQSGFWAPFAGALAGQALGSLLFRPQYYVPPVFQPGVMVGYGGYGSSYNQAISRYQQRYQAPPAEVRNRQAFRSTGQLRSPTFGSRTNTRNNRYSRVTERPTGSGYGTSTLRRSPRSTSRPSYGTRSRGSFGSGVRPRSSFGSRRR